MGTSRSRTPRERLVYHVQNLERLEQYRQAAANALQDAFSEAKREGYDTGTLKVVLRLRKMTPEQRKEKRALEAIYLAALGMLEGDPLPDEARRRLDGQHEERPPTPGSKDSSETKAPDTGPPAPPPPPQQQLPLKDPEEARKEGSEAAAAGKRIYDNPYPAGDPCRAAWDEGWCAQRKSHGMDPPAAYQRRTEKPPDKDEKGKGSGDGEEKGAA